MPKIKIELTETDMKAALAFWVDQGMPKADEAALRRVSMNYSAPPAGGRDPREYGYHYASVESGEGQSDG